MVKTSKGFRRATRKKLKRDFKQKFKVTPYLREFNKDDRVVIKIDSTSQKGMPFPKLKGKTGKIKGKRGGAYLVEVKSGNKTKEIISRPEHLRPHA